MNRIWQRLGIAGVVLVCMVCAAAGASRTWTSSTGSKVQAEFVKEQFGRVYLKKADGNMIQIPVESLSAADQEHVASLRPKTPARPPAPVYVKSPGGKGMLGWRGDGSGVFADQKPLLSWDGASGRNILWRTEMPDYANSMCIVTGGRVFTLADEHLLLCLDGRTGTILWQKKLNPFEFAGASSQEAEKGEQLLVLVRRMHGIMDSTGIGGTRHIPVEKGKAGWYKMKEVLQEMKRLGMPGLNVQMPADEEIDKEHDYEHSGLNKYHGNVRNWIQQKYGFPPLTTWVGCMGWTIATPVSDGAHVYVEMGQRQVAKFDLDGNRKWARVFGDPSTRCTFTPSPLVVDDTLILQAGNKLAALKCSDGNTIWQNDYKVPDSSYNCGTAWVMRLGSEQKPVFVTAAGHVIGVKDGKTLADLGVQNCGSESGGASPVGDGKDVVFMYPGRNEGGDLIAFRLALESGKITAKEIWRSKHKQKSASPVCHDGRLYIREEKGLAAYDISNGSQTHFEQCATGWPSFSVAGKHLFVPDGDGTLTVLSTGATPKIVFQGKYTYEGQKERIQTAPFFADNRIYLRTHKAVYCIGR